MSTVKFLWPITLVVAAAVVAWKAMRGEFVGMDLFPLVFAAVVVLTVLSDLLVFRRARRRARVLLGSLAVALACFGAVAHHRVLAERRAVAEQRGTQRWLGRDLHEVSFDHGWNIPAGVSAMAIERGTTLVNFWGTWCDPCVKEMPDLDAAWKRHRDRGLQILGLTTDWAGGGEEGLAEARNEVAAFLETTPVEYPILLLEPEAFAAFEVDSFPTTLWLEDGVVKGYLVGIDGTQELLDLLDL